MSGPIEKEVALTLPAGEGAPATGFVGEVILGKYKVERELGRGGMGFVVAARHLELGELVAIKMILGEFARNDEMVRRFMREARAAAQIASEHVVRVTDVGRLPTNEPYMVMEMLKGEDLEQVLATRGALPIAEAVDLVLQVIEAVAEAHAAGIIHRDLKPANLFVTRRRSGTPCVKVLDFGISKLANEETTSKMAMTQGPIGSPLYMSPEQLRSSADIDGRADIWSLGVILYQMLTLEFPFVADSLPQLIAKVLDLAPTGLRALRPEIPEGLEEVVMRCIAKDRDRRYASVTELAYALAPFGTVASQGSLAAVENALPSTRDVTSSPTMPARADSSPDLGVARTGPKGTVAMWPNQASTLEPLDASPQLSITRPGASTSKGRTFGILATLGLVAAAAIAVVAFTTKGRPSAEPTHVAPANAPAPDQPTHVTATPATPSPSTAPTPVPMAPSASTAPSAAPALGSSAVRPALAAPKGDKAKPGSVVPGEANPPPNCSPPYRVSETGAHVPKPECL